jgi:hypothetical protein
MTNCFKYHEKNIMSAQLHASLKLISSLTSRGLAGAIRIFPWSLCLALAGCSSFPEPKLTHYKFPKNAFVGNVSRPYTVLGPVRSKADYASLDAQHEEKELCRTYYNKAVKDLVKFAKKQGADAVVDVQSVVFLEDGRHETYKTPECSDDGGEGQVLTQGIAVKWTGGAVDTGTWTQPNGGTGPTNGAYFAAPANSTDVPTSVNSTSAYNPNSASSSLPASASAFISTSSAASSAPASSSGMPALPTSMSASGWAGGAGPSFDSSSSAAHTPLGTPVPGPVTPTAPSEVREAPHFAVSYEDPTPLAQKVPVTAPIEAPMAPVKMEMTAPDRVPAGLSSPITPVPAPAAPGAPAPAAPAPVKMEMKPVSQAAPETLPVTQSAPSRGMTEQKYFSAPKNLPAAQNPAPVAQGPVQAATQKAVDEMPAPMRQSFADPRWIPGGRAR